MLTLTVDSGYIWIVPWVPQLVPALSYSKLTKQERHPFNYINEKKYMYTVRPSGGMDVGLTYEGLLGIVCRCLSHHNIAYTIDDQRPAIEEADLTQLQPLRVLQDQALAVLLNKYIGIIKCPPGFGKTYIISQLPRIYPKTRIVIMTPRKDVVKSILERVKKSAPNPKDVHLLDGGKKFREDAHVIVSTAGSIKKIPEGWPELFIYDECHGCATGQQLPYLSLLTCRRFGLSASPDGRLDGADLEITGIFGDVECDIPYNTAQDEGLVVPIYVNMIEINMNEPIAKSDIKKQRLGYWSNNIRNHWVAWCARQHGPNESVLILVKTLEHALFLRLLLPEFFVVHGGVDEDKWQDLCAANLVADTPEFRQYVKDIDVDGLRGLFADGTINKVISTPKWKEGVDFPDLRVLIRADGSSGSIDSIQIIGRLSRVLEGKHYGLVYDFIDNFGPSYLRKSQRRMKHYENEGWSVRKPGVS